MVPLLSLRKLAWGAALCALGWSGQAQAWIIGQVAPFSGTQATQARAYAEGMRLHFDQLNKDGGIQGETLTLMTDNDRGQPQETVQLTRKLLASNPIVLAGYFGDSNLRALADSRLLESSGISLVGYRSVDPGNWKVPQFFSTRASTADEMAKIASHLATVGITKLGLFYEEGPGSAAIVNMVEAAIKPSGGSLVAHAMLAANKGRHTADAVSAISKAAPQAILIVASSGATAAFIEHYRISGGVAQLYANSDADIEQLIKRLSVEHMSGISISQVVPTPYRVSRRLNKEFRDLVTAKGSTLQEPVSYATIEGYINAKVIAEALRRIPKGAGPEKVAAALHSIQSLDLGGYWVTFKPNSNQGSRFVELSIVNSSGRISH
ncbi:ABC transporter substrate-binding protein [Giesbergeria anulus]|uniref:ABC-type branched-chain amino acid transport system, substrate-binding protein n=1 Tax=Giesbergeria anulus TaxID=180197 RepID=A0A1H9GE29_9BURK|nr:ABC transporter substrate-binding protein [Giesbergeria anulus]SEQ48350.1 ABC-type branched-chain amino acid transport system, substrate-binding protein [Giesbergeria anulus]